MQANRFNGLKSETVKTVDFGHNRYFRFRTVKTVGC